MAIVALIPARGGSKGVPRKNIKLMAGKPLIQYTIEAAQSCEAIDHIVVNTEDEEISQLATALGTFVQGRPEEYWYDNSVQEVDRLLRWSVLDLESQGIEPTVILLLYPTAPLRKASSIKSCLDLVLSGDYDSALTLKEDRSYLWQKTKDECVEPTNYNPKSRGPNQLEGWNQWVENKAVYAFKRDLLIDTGCRLGGKIGYVEMSKLDSIDIDTLDDFKLAENVLTSDK